MKYIFLNPNSCSGLASTKWAKISHEVEDFSRAMIVKDFYNIDWSKLDISPGDTFLSAGGDGTLHCMVNALIQNRGVDILSQVKVGHIGLGSNNSFLRPYQECKVVHHIPMRISDDVVKQDLIEIEIVEGEKIVKVYCVANSSLGFLATANIIFNTSSDVAKLKKWNSDLADVYTFLKALLKWQPITIQYEYQRKEEKRSITNMHLMKRAFYATDLGFPEEIIPGDGAFRLNILWERNRLVIFKKFFSMMVFKNLLEGRDVTEMVSEMSIKSRKPIPIEIDGEIYYGKDFRIKTKKEGIQLCR